MGSKSRKWSYSTLLVFTEKDAYIVIIMVIIMIIMFVFQLLEST